MRTSHGGGFGCRGAGGRAGIERLSSGLLPTFLVLGSSSGFGMGPVLLRRFAAIFFLQGLLQRMYKALGRALQLLEVERYGRNDVSA